MAEIFNQQRMSKCIEIHRSIMNNWRQTGDFNCTIRATDSVEGITLDGLRKRYFAVGVGDDLTEIPKGEGRAGYFEEPGGWPSCDLRVGLIFRHAAERRGLTHVVKVHVRDRLHDRLASVRTLIALARLLLEALQADGRQVAGYLGL